MNYDRVLVVGVNSSIASFLLPELNLDKKKLYGITQNPNMISHTWIEKSHIFVSNYPIHEKIQNQILTAIVPSRNEKVLVLNFAGYFGDPAILSNMNLESVVDVVDKNLLQFLSLVQLFLKLPPGSLFVGFSGAGVGGDSVDASSLGYFLSKISLAGAVEVIDRELKNENKRMTLIAPGPFPSEMQQKIARAGTSSVSELAQKKAQDVQLDGDKLKKLVIALNWVATNPNEAGGKIWSAQRDDFLNPSEVINFGLLRRIIS
jgi:hypothetical protein